MFTFDGYARNAARASETTRGRAACGGAQGRLDRGARELRARAGPAADHGPAPGRHADPTALDRVGEVVREPGLPLPAPLRERFEAPLAEDFSDVRVHADGAAQRSAAALGARGYSIGSHVVLGAEAFPPTRPDAQRLLAHELAHVAQRGDASTRRSSSPLDEHATVAAPEHPRERDAARVATALTHASAAPDAAPLLGPRNVPGQLVLREAQAGGAGATEPVDHPAGSLYARGPDGRMLPPSLDDISQGALNDCFLFAALAAIVASDPKRIVNMIAYGPNQTYTVTFKGLGGWFSTERQTVSADFVKGKHANVVPGRQALWPLVIEKAYAQEKGGLAEIDKGGNAGDVVNDLLNDGASHFDPRTKTADYILGKIERGRRKHWPMTIISPKQEDASKEKREIADSGGLHFWHTYAIVDVDAKNERIKLFNPWGNTHPHGDGWVPIAEVRKFFIEVDIND